ncbi:MAG TPA: hypothetical protein VKW04_03370 [Planctomycetota bacterium]|nr:hypothetical protein [Planctomycetota bacterium]
MKSGTNSIWRAVLALLATATLATGQQAGTDAKPADDDPPVGKGKLILLEDFETTAVGQVPKGYAKQGAVSVVDDVAHSGRHSLRCDAAPNGARRITLKGEILKELGGSFWGRLYFKVLTPSPDPEKVHSTFVSAEAKSPLHQDAMETRMLGTVLGNKGTFGYLFNVQPHAKRAEFGKSGASKNTYKNEWTLAEWCVDHETQTYRLFIDGAEMKDVSFSKGAGNLEGAELPEIYESLSFGFTNYQQAGKGFTVWIDDIALSKDRVGTRGLPQAKSAKK